VEQKPFYIGTYNKSLYIKLYGDITVKNIFPLKKFLQDLDLSFFFHIVFDFQEAEYLDSTSLGIVISTGLSYKDLSNRKLSFINMPEGLDESFKTFGFYEIADINTDITMSFNQDILVPLPDENEKIDGQGILEAHKALADINDKNKERFKTLIDLLEKQL